MSSIVGATNILHTAGPVDLDPFTFATLPTSTAINGTIVYGSDCKNVTDDKIASRLTRARGAHWAVVNSQNKPPWPTGQFTLEL